MPVVYSLYPTKKDFSKDGNRPVELATYLVKENPDGSIERVESREYVEIGIQKVSISVKGLAKLLLLLFKKPNKYLSLDARNAIFFGGNLFYDFTYPNLFRLENAGIFGIHAKPGEENISEIKIIAISPNFSEAVKQEEEGLEKLAEVMRELNIVELWLPTANTAKIETPELEITEKPSKAEISGVLKILRFAPDKSEYSVVPFYTIKDAGVVKLKV